MDLSQETKDNKASPSGEAPDDDKELQKQRAGSSGGGDDNDDDEGTRQPYKCTFCRRGFPTAQALGGHMNIHRKDRGGKPATAPPQQDDAGGSRTYGGGDVHLGLSLGRKDDVDLELRLGGYPYN